MESSLIKKIEQQNIFSISKNTERSDQKGQESQALPIKGRVDTRLFFLFPWG